MLQGAFINEEMKLAKNKKKVIRRWSKEDLKTMKSMGKAKAGVTKIAKALKRTPGAVSLQAVKHGISLSMRD